MIYSLIEKNKVSRIVYFFDMVRNIPLLSIFLLFIFLSPIQQVSAYHINRDYTNLTGEKIAFDVFEGKWLFVEAFWTECGACIRQHPILGDIYSNYKNDLQMISLAVFPQDNLQTINDFAQSHVTPWTMALDGEYTFQNEYNVKSTPTMILFNPDGIEIYRRVGYTSYNELSETIDYYVIQKNTDASFTYETKEEQGSVIGDLFSSPIFKIVFFGTLIMMIYFKSTGGKN